MAETAPASRKRASNSNRGSKPGERRGGRQKGTVNKITKDIREAIAEMLEASAPRMGEWLERVAETDPAKALDLALKAAEYAIPKLSRVDMPGGRGPTLEDLIVGSHGNPFVVVTGVPQSEAKPGQECQQAHEQPAQPPAPRSIPQPEPPPLRLRPDTYNSINEQPVISTGYDHVRQDRFDSPRSNEVDGPYNPLDRNTR